MSSVFDLNLIAFWEILDRALVIRMGNTQARRRLNAKDFQYIANNTALLNMQIVTE